MATSCSLQSTDDANTKIGRITGNENLESALDIQTDAKVNIDVSANGSISEALSKEVTNTLTTDHTPNSASSRIVKGNFTYGEYSCTSRDIYPYNWTEVRPIEFNGHGGTSTVYGIDGSTPSGTVLTMDPGQTWERYISNGYRFGSAVTVYNVTLGAEVAYSSNHKYTFKAINTGTYLFDKDGSKKAYYSTKK